MKQFAIIGLGPFGQRMAEELSQIGVDLLILDKNRETVDRYRHLATAAYCVDALNREAVGRTVPADVDAAIVDLGGRMETSILAVNYLKKLGIRQIIVKAENDEHGEILTLVGADRLIFPDREAAKKITPLLVSSSILNFLPAGRGFVVAEVRVPEVLVGGTLRENDVRRKFGVNVVAVRREENDGQEYEMTSIDYRFQAGDILLVAGQEKRVAGFSGIAASVGRKAMRTLLRRLQAV